MLKMWVNSALHAAPAPLWEIPKCPFSFDGNESEGLNKGEVKCRAVTVSVELNAIIVLLKRLAQ